MLTLATYSSSAVRDPKPVNLTVNEFCHQHVKFMNAREGKGKRSAVQDAAEFYALNHLRYEIEKLYDSGTPLPEPVAALVRTYQTLVPELALTLCYYMLGSCVREARHLGHHSSSLQWQDYIEKKASPSTELLEAMSGTSGSQAIKKFYRDVYYKAGGEPVTNLSKVLTEVFTSKMKWSSAYGGVAWGKIAKVLHSFLSGQITAEMLVDTAFTLAHNGGPMFNKGYLYGNTDSHVLVKLLDVQNKGQMPQYIANSTASELKRIKDLMLGAKQYLPSFLFSKVDYKAVAADKGCKGKVEAPAPSADLPKHIPLSVADLKNQPLPLSTPLNMLNMNLKSEVRDG